MKRKTARNKKIQELHKKNPVEYSIQRLSRKYDISTTSIFRILHQKI